MFAYVDFRLFFLPLSMQTKVRRVWGMLLQWRSTIKVSTELPVTTRHPRDMTETLLKATLNPNNNNKCFYMYFIVSFSVTPSTGYVVAGPQTTVTGAPPYAEAPPPYTEVITG